MSPKSEPFLSYSYLRFQSPPVTSESIIDHPKDVDGEGRAVGDGWIVCVGRWVDREWRVCGWTVDREFMCLVGEGKGEW